MLDARAAAGRGAGGALHTNSFFGLRFGLFPGLLDPFQRGSHLRNRLHHNKLACRRHCLSRGVFSCRHILCRQLLYALRIRHLLRLQRCHCSGGFGCFLRLQPPASDVPGGYSLILPGRDGGLQKCLGCASPQLAECGHRQEGASVGFDVKLCKFQRKISRFSELRRNVLLRQRTAPRLLYERSRRRHRCTSILRCQLQPRLFSRRDHGSCIHARLPVLLQIPFADSRQQRLVRTAVARLVHGHQLSPVPALVVAGAQVASDVEAVQCLQILRIDAPGAGPALLIPVVEAVDVFAVNGGRAGHVFRLFHSSLDLEGVNAGVQELRKDRQCAHVLHRKRIAHAALGKRRSVLSDRLIGKTAGSSASPPVAASAAQKAGQKAFAGIGIAHGAVDEALDLEALLLEHLNFSEGEFPGRHHAHKALPL